MNTSIEKKIPGGSAGQAPNRMPGGASIDKFGASEGDGAKCVEDVCGSGGEERVHVCGGSASREDLLPESRVGPVRAEGGGKREDEEGECNVNGRVGWSVLYGPFEEARKMLKGLERLVDEVFAKAKVKREYRDTLIEGVRNLADVFTEMELENAGLRGREKERGEIIDKFKKVGEDLLNAGGGFRAERSYAVTTGGRNMSERVSDSLERKSGKRYEVVVTMDGKDAEDVRRSLMKESPKEIGVRVDGLVNTRRGLIVRVRTKEEMEKLVGNNKLRDKGYVVVERESKRPMIMLCDVLKGDEREILGELYERNFAECMSAEEFLRDVTVKRKVRQEQGRSNKDEALRETWIAEVSGAVFKKCVNMGRVYMGWESIRVKEYVDVVRCFRCQSYGHVGKVCRERVETCGFCAGEHGLSKCEAARDEEECANCKREGKKSNHSVSWSGCEVFKKTVERYYSKVNYDS